MEIMPSSNFKTADGCLTLGNPPMSNTGGTVSVAYSHLVMVDGKVMEIPLKRGNETAGFIDTLTLVMHRDVFVRADQLGADDEVIANASAEILEIMGYGITCENKGGRNFYKRSFLMGTNADNYGFFAMGGNKSKNDAETVCFSFTGTGLIAALEGWESRLYEFIKARAPETKITRCDIAHDFLDGEYTCEEALQDWENGLYTTHYNKPIPECVGGDWKLYRGTGKTLYIGSRKNASRYVRVYEKGKQLGDEMSPWVRAEVEFRSRDIVIPHDVLIEPGKYLAGSYPALEAILNSYSQTPAKVEVKKKIEDISVAHVLKYASMQSAPSIVMLKEQNLSNDEIVEILLNGHDKMPKRLKKEAFDCMELNIRFVHEFGRLPLTESEIIEKFADSLSADKPKMKHRTMADYLRLSDEVKLNNQFKPFRSGGGTSKSYLDYMADRHGTPSFILNPNFKD